MASPLAQFEIKKIIPLEVLDYDISFTNSSLAMLSTVILIFSFLYLGVRKLNIVPSRSQTLVESTYEFISNMINDNIGEAGLKYFSLIFI